ncbi:MAG: hypothetical protein ABSA46_17235 [Thermodesulfovibrionales bacterium]|jgi:hypothetical protein
MTKYKGGHKAGKGTYWNLANGSMVDIPDEEVLPGDEKTTYLRVPVIGDWDARCKSYNGVILRNGSAIHR